MPLAVHLDLAGLRVVVVGGGPVGLRRARLARDAGASVTVIDPDPRLTISSDFTWVAEPFRPDNLTGARLVLACATAGVNAEVVAAAHLRGIWVSDAAEPGRSDLTFLAAGSRGPITLAVGTSGASPRLSKLILDELLHSLDPNMTEWAECLTTIRPVVLGANLDAGTRRRWLTDFAGLEWGERIRRDGAERTLAAMRESVTRAGAKPGGAVVGGADSASAGVADEDGEGGQADARQDAGAGGEVVGDREGQPERQQD